MATVEEHKRKSNILNMVDHDNFFIPNEGIPQLTRNTKGKVVCKFWDFQDLLGKQFRSHYGGIVEICDKPRPHFKKIRDFTEKDWSLPEKEVRPMLYVSAGEFIYFD